MRKKSPFLSAQEGFSLAEILAAVALLAIFLAASAPLLTSSFKGIMDSGGKSKSIYAAQQGLGGENQSSCG